ncbi:trichohyalin-like [Cydia strobilella]|uniref:trichohyalin-like n=1 Tax=Cydia strobilella TaxID=1100964 RepID=UPI003007C538
MSKLKLENKEEYFAKKREQAKLWYQNIKNNPDLYAEYQRKNRLKYEKRLAQKKVVPISEMTSTQQRKQREKWREERKRRNQRIKEKKERERQSMAENSPPEGDIYPVHLIETILLPNPENTEEDFTIETDSQDISNQDIKDNLELNTDYQSRNENNTMQEHIPTIEKTYCQQKNQTGKIGGRKGRLEPAKDKTENLKPENTEEVFTIKMVSEDLSYQSINDNPELNLSDIGNRDRKKAQGKNVPSNEMTSCQRQMQRETLRDHEGEVQNNIINNNPELNLDYQGQYERNKEQENITPRKEMSSSQQKMQRQNLRKEGKRRCQPKKEKKEKRTEKWRAESKRRYQQMKEKKDREKHSVTANKQAYLTKKREQAKLWYQKIKNNPELYAEYQRKNRLKYEKRIARKKVVPISEMTSTQQRKQRKKWREESNRRYQRKKGKKERDKQSGAENNSPEDNSYPVNLIETILIPNFEKSEEVFTIKTESQDVNYQDINDNLELNSDYQREHENNTKQEEHISTIKITSCQQKNKTYEPDKDKNEILKPENTEEVFTIEMESEDLGYQSINDNPEFNSSDIGNYERKKAQDKNVPSNEITSCQHLMQREKLSDNEVEVNREEVFPIKTESEELNDSLNNSSELNLDYLSQYERNKEQEKNTPTKEMSSSQQIMQRTNLREKRKICQPKKDKKDKRKQSREELLAKKRERARLRYHYIKNNPELYSEYQRKQNTNYENRKAQKKILTINEMTPSQQKRQRKKWRAESKRRYQQMKEGKEREKLYVAENKEAYLTKKREQQKMQREKWRAESKRKCQLKERKEREKQYVAENKEAYLTNKREQAKLWYQKIKNNPELYAEYQRKNRLKYEKRIARKKVVPISEMTSTQQRKQRKKWREESKRSYQRRKDKKE